MTLNELLNKGLSISRMLTSCDIPMTMNGEPIDVDITLEGENGNYWADLKVIGRKKK